MTKSKVNQCPDQWQDILVEVFEEEIQPSSSTRQTKVSEDTSITLKDARSLFGKTVVKNKIKLTLRTSRQMKCGSIIVLQQFDPNFFSPYETRCRMSGCPEKKPRNQTTKSSKEDLYLCPTHQARMTDYVTKRCAEKNVAVNFESSNPRDFDGYISLIGLTEKAFYRSNKAMQENRSLQLFPEIFLNVRNFLFITNAVLNPDEGNLGLVLPPVMNILMDILNRRDSREFVENLAFLMRDIIETILFAFGVVYGWVSLTGNLGAQVGMGVGGAIGCAAAHGVLGGLIGLGVGLLCGGLIGSGIYIMQEQVNEQRRQDEGLRRYSVFMRRPVASQCNLLYMLINLQPQPNADIVYICSGNVFGDLSLAVLEVASIVPPLLLNEPQQFNAEQQRRDESLRLYGELMRRPTKQPWHFTGNACADLFLAALFVVVLLISLYM